MPLDGLGTDIEPLTGLALEEMKEWQVAQPQATWAVG
jgi:hypothetical protein